MTPYESLVEKLGEQGAKEEMRRRAQKKRKNYKGGFGSWTEEKRKEVSRKGGQNRWRKDATDI